MEAIEEVMVLMEVIIFINYIQIKGIIKLLTMKILMTAKITIL